MKQVGCEFALLPGHLNFHDNGFSVLRLSPSSSFQPNFQNNINMTEQSNKAPPVNASISSSASTCSLGGSPPFTVTISYKCITSSAIWALFKPHAIRGNGCEIRDPRRKHRRIGPSNRYLEDEGDTELDFTELVRRESGEEVVKRYEFIVGDYSESLSHNDIHNLVAGNEYVLGIRHQKWWYVNVEHLPEQSIVEEKMLPFLMQQPAVEWRPENTMSFGVVD